MHLNYLGRNSESAHTLTHFLARTGVRSCSGRALVMPKFNPSNQVRWQVGQFLPLHKSLPGKNVSSPVTLRGH